MRDGRTEAEIEATRVISVVVTPGPAGAWDAEVDYDEWVTPFEAYGALYAACLKMEQQFGKASTENEERDGD